MNENFNIQIVLVAPLDWGLGHATRCIPIINALQKKYTVMVACNNEQKKLLQQEFSNISFLQLKGYHVKYAKKKWLLPFKILWQIPKILKAIKQENIWLQKAIDEHNIDIVISDNRYGLHSKKVPCVFVTHQLTIQTPFKWLTHVAQKINYRYINKFSACWVPDVKGEKNIAGILSHPKKFPTTTVNYLGILSRFNTKEVVAKKFDYCILLSGPEPQRSILEQKILANIHEQNKKIILLRGLPNEIIQLSSTNNTTIYNHLKGDELLQIILQSEYIICRSGYTTIMEMLALQKKMIVIPTPAQTEQEYLATHLMQQGFCLSIEQTNFSLVKAIPLAEQFNFTTPNLLSVAVENLIDTLIYNLKK